MDNSWIHNYTLFKFSSDIPAAKKGLNLVNEEYTTPISTMDPVTAIYATSSDDVSTQVINNQTQSNSTRDIYDFYRVSEQKHTSSYNWKYKRYH